MPTRKELIASGAEITPLTREEILMQGGELTPLNVKEKVLSGIVGGGAPSGKITITQNGTDIDVAQYATADVNVSASISLGKIAVTNNTGVSITVSNALGTNGEISPVNIPNGQTKNVSMPKVYNSELGSYGMDGVMFLAFVSGLNTLTATKTSGGNGSFATVKFSGSARWCVSFAGTNATTLNCTLSAS
jgi:hypothetical protein